MNGWMQRHVVRAITILLTALVIAGCSQDFLVPAVDRINAAFPLKPEIEEMAGKVDAAIKDDATRSEWRSQYAAKQKERVLSCANGFKPSWLDSSYDIRSKLKNHKCFRTFDNAQIQWLKWLRVHSLLMAPPLQPLPVSIPSQINATRRIEIARFAENAGVALFQSSDGLEIVDINTDATILVDPEARAYLFRPRLSSNGRVFALVRPLGQTTSIVLRESETGDTLIHFDKFSDFQWIDDSSAWVALSGYQQGSAVMDLATGELTQLKGMTQTPHMFARISENTFLARTFSELTILTSKSSENGVHLSATTERSWTGRGWSSANSALTVDGEYFVEGQGIYDRSGSSRLGVVHLPMLSVEELDMDTFAISRLTPVKERELLMTFQGSTIGGGVIQAVFDPANETFAIIDDELFTSNEGPPPQTLFIPALRRVGVQRGATVRLVEDIRTQPALKFEDFIRHLHEHKARYEKALAGR